MATKFTVEYVVDDSEYDDLMDAILDFGGVVLEEKEID